MRLALIHKYLISYHQQESFEVIELVVWYYMYEEINKMVSGS